MESVIRQMSSSLTEQFPFDSSFLVVEALESRRETKGE